MKTTSPTRYSWQVMALHWLSAIIIIWATISGFYLSLGNPSQTVADFISFFNVSVTFLFIPFFALRVYYILKKGKPAATQQGLQAKIATVTHLIIYLNIAIVLITGVLMMTKPISVFDIVYVPTLLDHPVALQFFHSAHKYACASLGILIAAHVGAVLQHHLFGHPILYRMLPTWLKKDPKNTATTRHDVECNNYSGMISTD